MCGFPRNLERPPAGSARDAYVGTPASCAPRSTTLVELSCAPGTGDQTRPARGLLVTAQQIAADVGRDLLAAGGSAVDAIVAAAFALCVVDPSNCGIGGYGGFLVYAPAGDEPFAVEFNTWMPSRLDVSQLRQPGLVGPI